MLVTVVVNILNIIGNYSLIFGRFGFPELGVEGAAISTAFSRGVSMILLFIILFRKHIHRFPVAYFRPFPWIELKNLMKIGLPSAGRTTFLQFFASSDYLLHQYAGSRSSCHTHLLCQYHHVCLSVQHLHGAGWCHLHPGHLIGEKKPHAAFLMGKYVMKKSVMITVILSTILAIFGNTIFHWLTTNEEIIRLGPPSSSSTSFLKSDVPSIFSQQMPCVPPGDVTYPFYVGLVVQWSVAVGLGYIIGIPLEWGICGMWVAFLLDENIRGAIFVKRWYSMKWTTKGFVK